MITALDYALDNYTKEYKSYLKEKGYEQNEETALMFIKEQEGELEDQSVWHS